MEEKFKEFMSKLVLPEANLEELQGSAKEVIDEVQAKDTRIAELETQLNETNEKYNTLKDRALESLFNNKQGNPQPTIDDKKDKPEPKKTFKDLYKQDANWNL